MLNWKLQFSGGQGLRLELQRYEGTVWDDFGSRQGSLCCRAGTGEMDIFPYLVFYIFFEQYLEIWRIALINIAIALSAIFIVCLLMTSSLWSSAILILVLAMIVVDLMGVMAILDIQLNAVSVVILIMSIGIAVEFCVHIMHAYLMTFSLCFSLVIAF